MLISGHRLAMYFRREELKFISSVITSSERKSRSSVRVIIAVVNLLKLVAVREVGEFQGGNVLSEPWEVVDLNSCVVVVTIPEPGLVFAGLIS